MRMNDPKRVTLSKVYGRGVTVSLEIDATPDAALDGLRVLQSIGSAIDDGQSSVERERLLLRDIKSSLMLIKQASEKGDTRGKEAMEISLAASHANLALLYGCPLHPRRYEVDPEQLPFLYGEPRS